MPKNQLYQIWIMKRFVAWYSSCIQIKEEGFKVDMACFTERENRFLKLFLKSLEHFFEDDAYERSLLQTLFLIFHL